MSQVTPAGSESPVKRVLVVEDDDDLRGMMQELLIGAGYECIDAQDGLEALDWLSQVPVDLVVADILMPRMAGPELIAKIRRTRAWAEKPILLLSGYANLVPYRSLPVDGVQLKPFSVSDFLAQVQEMIGSPTG
jgi:CheY-like chemotaxis protein